MKKTIIKLENIVKKFYINEPNELEILHGISLEVKEGEFVSIVGPSGSGKSTLMNMIGALDRPTTGSYYLDGIDVEKAEDDELSEIRNQKVGFVFQTYNLIPKTNAIRNVELPMLYAGVERTDRHKRAMELLTLVEMADRARHLPEELSGGQKQRVAIARAMANDPAIILADEPTGALDSKTGRLVMDIFHKLNKEQNKTIVLITHSNELADETDRIVNIRDGIITDITINTWNKKSNNYDPTISKNNKKSNKEDSSNAVTKDENSYSIKSFSTESENVVELPEIALTKKQNKANKKIAKKNKNVKLQNNSLNNVLDSANDNTVKTKTNNTNISYAKGKQNSSKKSSKKNNNYYNKNKKRNNINNETKGGNS